METEQGPPASPLIGLKKRVESSTGEQALSRIVVSRTSEKDLKIRDVELRIDGKYAQILRFGNVYECEIEPGSHSLTATNRLFSKTIEFIVEPGETAWFMATAIPLERLWHILTIIGTIPYAVGLARLPNLETEIDAISGAHLLPGEEFD